MLAVKHVTIVKQINNLHIPLLKQYVTVHENFILHFCKAAADDTLIGTEVEMVFIMNIDHLILFVLTCRRR